MNFKNVSPLGDLEIAGVGHVAHGDTFEATGDAAKQFADDTENFARSDKPKADKAATEEK